MLEWYGVAFVSRQQQVRRVLGVRSEIARAGMWE